MLGPLFRETRSFLKIIFPRVSHRVKHLIIRVTTVVVTYHWKRIPFEGYQTRLRQCEMCSIKRVSLHRYTATPLHHHQPTCAYIHRHFANQNVLEGRMQEDLCNNFLIMQRFPIRGSGATINLSILEKTIEDIEKSRVHLKIN